LIAELKVPCRLPGLGYLEDDVRQLHAPLPCDQILKSRYSGHAHVWSTNNARRLPSWLSHLQTGSATSVQKPHTVRDEPHEPSALLAPLALLAPVALLALLAPLALSLPYGPPASST
jgi:hypothetical protein